MNSELSTPNSFSSLAVPLPSTALAEDRLEDVPDRALRERSTTGLCHMAQDGGLAARVKHRPLSPLLDPADQQGELGALAQQTQELVVQMVNPAADRREPGRTRPGVTAHSRGRRRRIGVLLQPVL